jgi:hypothetical protein
LLCHESALLNLWNTLLGLKTDCPDLREVCSVIDERDCSALKDCSALEIDCPFERDCSTVETDWAVVKNDCWDLESKLAAVEIGASSGQNRLQTPSIGASDLWIEWWMRGWSRRKSMGNHLNELLRLDIRVSSRRKSLQSVEIRVVSHRDSLQRLEIRAVSRRNSLQRHVIAASALWMKMAMDKRAKGKEIDLPAALVAWEQVLEPEYARWELLNM